MTGRLIDVDKLNKRLDAREWFCRDPELGKVFSMINEAPTVDAVPVIRCKDCKYWGADGYRYGCKYATGVMFENDYCSRAERKDNATDRMDNQP